jgi:hypothetical protein
MAADADHTSSMLHVLAVDSGRVHSRCWTILLLLLLRLHRHMLLLRKGVRVNVLAHKSPSSISAVEMYNSARRMSGHKVWIQRKWVRVTIPVVGDTVLRILAIDRVGVVDGIREVGIDVEA